MDSRIKKRKLELSQVYEYGDYRAEIEPGITHPFIIYKKWYDKQVDAFVVEHQEVALTLEEAEKIVEIWLLEK